MIHVSILTTVYNGWEFLEECARSIYCQKSEYDGVKVEWEWLIGINGHGEGGGPAMVAAAAAARGPNIRVKNLSQVRGRVEALEELRTYCSPKSNWIAILDCDDAWMPEKLILQAIAITRSTVPIDVIGTFCEYFGERGGGPSLPGGWISPGRLVESNPIINSSALIRRELANWEDRCGLEDYDLWLRLARSGRKFFNIPHALVRHRIHSDSAFNGAGGKQRLPELRAFHGLCPPAPTVVSAYYPIASKNSSEQYMKWIEGFWPNMQCQLVFYTEPELAPRFREIFTGKKAVVVGLPFSELNAFRKIPASVWKDACALDTEQNHSAELYALWYEKKEFVLRTIQTNPFHSSKFVWCDAGIGRFPGWIQSIQGFPDETRIPLDKMVVLHIDPFQVTDGRGADDICGDFGTRSTVGGGILASGVEGWSIWSKAYDAVLLKYLRAGRFIGKDQNIMASVILEYPGLTVPIQRPTSLGPVAGWFYLLIYLAGLRISS